MLTVTTAGNCAGCSGGGGGGGFTSACGALTSGGGGYGSPLRRDPAQVAADVRLGYISRAAALNEYGVVFDDAGNVRERETAAERQRPTR